MNKILIVLILCGCSFIAGYKVAYSVAAFDTCFSDYEDIYKKLGIDIDYDTLHDFCHLKAHK